MLDAILLVACILLGRPLKSHAKHYTGRDIVLVREKNLSSAHNVVMRVQCSVLVFFHWENILRF